MLERKSSSGSPKSLAFPAEASRQLWQTCYRRSFLRKWLKWWFNRWHSFISSAGGWSRPLSTCSCAAHLGSPLERALAATSGTVLTFHAAGCCRGSSPPPALCSSRRSLRSTGVERGDRMTSVCTDPYRDISKMNWRTINGCFLTRNSHRTLPSRNRWQKDSEAPSVAFSTRLFLAWVAPAGISPWRIRSDWRFEDVWK